MELIARIEDAVARDGLIPPGTRVLVGLSGGADSVALVQALMRLGHDVVAAHLDHAAQPGSDETAAWVAARCEAWGLPLVQDRRPVPLGPGFEARARDARLAFLAEAAAEAGCGAVALAHHQGDQAETVLFRLARGAGLGGAAGMAPSRLLAPGIALIRPMLDVPRAAIRAALTAWGQAWRDDPMNLDPAFARTRLREAVLPALATVNPDAEAHLAAFAALAREEDAAMEEQTAGLANLIMTAVAPGVGEVDRGAFNALPAATRRRLLRRLASTLGATPPDARGLMRALAIAEAGGAEDLYGGWRVEAHKAWLALTIPKEGPAPAALALGEQATAPWGWRIAVREAAGGAPAGPCLARFDPTALPVGLAWRCADPAADRIQPWGHARATGLRGWLARRGVPAHRHGSLLVLAAGHEVAWVVGHGRASLAPVAGEGVACWEMQATARFRV